MLRTDADDGPLPAPAHGLKEEIYKNLFHKFLYISDPAGGAHAAAQGSENI
jgi:hypothetical protein